ncbi:MAG: RNA polymerase sigma factor [Candidatus Kapaibacterium sp.]|nr:RNA polymerase sigma factor [Bacteroidota bacterium]
MTTNYSTYTDAELYALLLGEKAEKDAAFQEIYQRYSSRIFLYCRKILGDPTLADDAFQETFALFVRSINADREMTNLPAFLLRIARNSCLRMKERDAQHPTMMFNEAMHFHEPGEQPVESEELAKLISMALDLLPDDQREALVLQAYEGLSYNEISEIMHVPITTVRNWIVRAKSKVRATLQPYWADYRR